MPRNYVRKGNRRPYTKEHLEEALRLLRTKELSLKGCARRFNIPRETLRDHFKGRRSVKGSSKGGCGRGTALPFEVENQLAACLRTMSKNGFGLTKDEVLDLVENYLNTTGTKTRLKNNRPGQEWWILFKTRHKLAIKKPEPLEHARKLQGCDPFIIYEFYNRLECAIISLGLVNKPKQIYNCDETSFCHYPNKTKVIAAVGKPCHRYTAGSGRQNTSILACVNAAGDKLPPLIIYKGKHMWDQWIPKDDIYPNTGFTSTPRGWMTADVFYNWFKERFLVSIGNERPVMLIFDGHTSHVTPQLMEIAAENKVDIQKLPAHTSHLLQPLDVSCFRAMKIKWDKILSAWQRNNVGQCPSKQNFAKLLGSTWNSLTPVNIQSGFKKTGIFDLDCENNAKVNRNAIDSTTFDPIKLRRYKEIQNSAADKNNSREIVSYSTPRLTLDTLQAGNSANESGQCSTEQIPIEGNPPLNGFELILLQTIRSSKTQDKSAPKKRIAGTACIVDSDLQVASKMTKTNAKPQAKMQTSTKTRNKKKTRDLSSESEEEFQQTTSDSDLDISDEEMHPLSDTEQSRDVNLNDFYLVRFPTKRNVRYFVGKVIKKSDDNWEMAFLRVKDKQRGIFKWPVEEDKDDVQESDLIKKLHAPTINRRGLHMFSTDFSHYNVS